MNKQILIIAGEASGDMHGVGLIKELRRINPQASFFGMGGDKMREAGVETFYHINQLSFMGFFEVLENLGFFREVMKKMTQILDERKPDLAILIDYPGFNLKLAEEIKKRKILILYYISPQVWAWGKGRIKKIKKLVDKMIVFFPFEEKIYKDAQVDVDFIGHPLLDVVKTSLTQDEFRNKFGIEKDQILIGLFPGSRALEVEKILPIMLSSCEIMKSKIKDLKVAVSLAPTIEKDYLVSFLTQKRLEVVLVEKFTYDLMRYSDFLLVKSGTSTLEAAIIGTPFVVIYKTGFLTWLVARSLVKVPYIGMVNLISGKKIVPEFVQYEAKPEKIAWEMYQFLTDKEKYQKMKDELSAVKEKLGEKGAYKRGAEIVFRMLGE
jgi:lipid-A-disaccharide synthase